MVTIPLRVDVLIPTHNEDVSVVRQTVESCLAQDYPDFDVRILDDQCRPKIRDLAIEMGVRYLPKSDNRGAKAGNLNNGLRHVKGGYVVVCDAGDLLHTTFLTETVPLLEQDPKLAFVQALVEPGADALQIALGKLTPPSMNPKRRQRIITRLFGTRYAYCNGSACVIRRVALDEIGGFPTKCMSEDFYLSAILHDRGWESVHSSNVLAKRPEAQGLVNYVMQQRRWSVGDMQLLSCRPNPLISRGIPMRARLKSTTIVLVQLYLCLGLIFLVLPLFFLIKVATSGSLNPIHLLLAIVLTLFGYLACSVVRRRSIWWTIVYSTIGAWSLAGAFASYATNPWKQPFRVTEKGPSSASSGGTKILIGPLYVYRWAYMAMIVYTCLSGVLFESVWTMLLGIWMFFNLEGIERSIGVCRSDSQV
jgi:cellulose synthase (UDP-forming)